ncbi:hypothetical protein KFL_008380070 [Klebsormidium nitens]|uniref:Uncharacterized protein n=1 Tax=Klebsormidium nitens TaxID=105231 RepID=A0A1Y1IST6_KLENI|nr:hypothetical protein KFL_008380070 [Klebsormidium nitens]|eukprot:GAQ91717.1 hypothetical protein KFL_008380070 [Klebsormidium nitens]
MQDYKRSASLKFGRRASMTKSRDFEPTVLVSGPLQGNMHNVPHSAVLDAIKTGEVPKTSILGALSEEEEGEEDEEDPRAPSTVRETRLSRRLLAYGQVTLGAYLVAQIVISLLFFSRYTIAELEVWKWTVLLLTLLSGRLIGRVLVYTMIFLLQMIFKDNGKILYVAYGVRRSAWNVIWCLQVLCVWTVLFNGRRKIVGKIPVKVNQILVCTQIATLVMAGKMIFIKILANAFHRKAYFERIRDAMFDHYVIERLSIPAYMLNRSSSSATTGIRGEPQEEVGILATLSQGQLGVRTFQSIMRFVRSTKITTISTQQQRDVRSEEHGRDAARDIFKNVVPEGRHHMAFESEEGVVTCESFENWLINVVRERKALALTLSDTKTAIRSLGRLLDWVVGVIVVLMCLFVLDVNVQKLLVVTSGSFLASLFVFGNTCKTVFESIIFLFVTHPFDVSDIIRVDGQTYVVEEMQLLSTILLAADNSKVYYSNNQLALKVISNYYRSPDQIELIDLALGWGTPQKKIEEMRACILRFLQANPEQWYPKIVSDLHMEMEHSKELPIIPAVAPHIALLGDISEPRSAEYAALVEDLSRKFETVLIIAGNHEFYGGEYEEVKSKIAKLAKKHDNVHFMDRKSISLRGVRVIGCTLWSRVPDHARDVVRNTINDYVRIGKKVGADLRPLTVEDTNALHERDFEFVLEAILEAEGRREPVLVLTHHAPLRKGVSAPAYEGRPTNYAFGTDLTEFMGPPVVAWAHGHTHYNTKQDADGTLVFSNQRGYRGEKCGEPYAPERVLRIRGTAASW